MSDYRNFRKDLGMTGDLADDINMDRLVKRYATKVLDKRAEEGSYESYNSNWGLEDLRKALKAVKREDKVEDFNGMLPIASVFDALQVVKKASKTASYDLGLRNFELYLDRIWKQDREACLTAQEFVNLREHYSRSYPKSAVVDVLDEISSTGYLTVKTPELIQIAARIRSQDDYDFEIMEAGLDSNTPNHVKAREFIRHLVNNREE